MLDSAFGLGEQLNQRRLIYRLHRKLWDEFTIDNIDLQFHNWTHFKYLNNTHSGLNTQVNQVPNDSGGLYLFYVKCEIISGITEYPFYIGRAKYTESQNLRKRVKEYYQKYRKNGERPKISRMFNYWAEDLYLAYCVLPDNQNIVELEAQLINCLLFPMNDHIPGQEIRQAIKAFQ